MTNNDSLAPGFTVLLRSYPTVNRRTRSMILRGRPKQFVTWLEMHTGIRPRNACDDKIEREGRAKSSPTTLVLN